MSKHVGTQKAAYVGMAAVLGIVGLVAGSVAVSWVAGSLGISGAAASQIVSAITAGGWALTAVLMIFGGGIIGAISATVRYMVVKKGRNVAIA